MISRAQQVLLKRAQHEAALSDDEYRDAVALVSGMADCRSSKDARLTDGHVDKLLAYFEAIHWGKVDSRTLQPSCKPNAVFRQRGYWAGKNRCGDTSRDRYVATAVSSQVADLEGELMALGCSMAYLRGIQERMKRGGKPFDMVTYSGALKRTLAAIQRKVDQPF